MTQILIAIAMLCNTKDVTLSKTNESIQLECQQWYIACIEETPFRQMPAEDALKACVKRKGKSK